MIQVDRDVLLGPLEAVHGIVETRHTQPILMHVLLEATGGRLRLTATDLTMQASAEVEADVEAPACTVPAHKLLELLRALPNETRVNLELDGARLRLSCGASRFRLQTNAAEMFPKMAPLGPEAVEAVVSQAALKRLLAQTQAAMADQDIRYYLRGTLLSVRGNHLALAATDGFRVAEAVAALETSTAAAKLILPLILPRKCALEVHRLLAHSDEPVRLRVQPNQAAFRFGQVELITAVVDGQFPDYQRVFPESFDQCFRVDRVPFTQALTRLRVLANQKYQGVHWHSGAGRLCMTADNAFQEDADETLLIECNSEVVDSGFSINYLLDGLDSVGGEEVECALVRARGCGGLQISAPGSTEFRYFVMSMKV